MDPLELRAVGDAGVFVSRLGIGGGSLFNRGGDDGTARVIDACWDAGLRHFDTSPYYAAGMGETRFGRALSKRPRREFWLSTKAGRDLVNGESVFDYSYDGVRRSIAGSLDRLGMDYVDIAMIHDVTRSLHGDAFDRRFDEAMNGAYEALRDLKREGVVRAVGVAQKEPDVLLRFARAGAFDCFMIAGCYTLLEHDSLEFLNVCGDRKIPVFMASPFNTGVLATGASAGARYQLGDAPAGILERTRALEAVCARWNVPLAAAALQFPLRHPAIASVVVGHENPQEVLRNLDLIRLAIPDGLWDDLCEDGLIPEA